ncbi:MAG: hypothetical protein EP298_13130 [Gammaproteobacteria bacterium]|nr:MAG: hypothetical protein EP298_13130 [Gammaproteobacteria bacterium]UTW41779.1 hypothetical protein KFE69_09705 [bacterium SCSIO 12844]
MNRYIVKNYDSKDKKIYYHAFQSEEEAKKFKKDNINTCSFNIIKADTSQILSDSQFMIKGHILGNDELRSISNESDKYTLQEINQLNNSEFKNAIIQHNKSALEKLQIAFGGFKIPETQIDHRKTIGNYNNKNVDEFDFIYNEERKCFYINNIGTTASSTFNFMNLNESENIYSVGRNREYSKLDLSDGNLNEIYKQLKEYTHPYSQIYTNKVLSHSGEKGITKNLLISEIVNYLSFVSMEPLNSNHNLPDKYNNEEINITEFMKKGNHHGYGVCRHRALLAAALLTKYCHDNNLNAYIATPRVNLANENKSLAGGHTFCVFYVNNETFFIDPMWNHVNEYNKDKTNLEKPYDKGGYGKEIIDFIMKNIEDFKETYPSNIEATSKESNSNFYGGITIGRGNNAQFFPEHKFMKYEQKNNLTAKPKNTFTNE